MVVKNLDDTDKFLQKQNYIQDNTQVIISIEDFQKEVGKLLKQNSKDIDEVLENDIFEDSFMKLKLKELDLSFKLKKYDRVDINDIAVKDSNILREYFSNNNVFNYDYLVDIYKEKFQNSDTKVENSKQLDDIINTFILRSYSKDILKIKDNLGFFKPDNLYELDIKVKYNSATASAYYILKKEGEVQYFDVSFK